MAGFKDAIAQYLGQLTGDISQNGVLGALLGTTDQAEPDMSSFSAGPNDTFQNQDGAFSKTKFHDYSSDVEDPKAFQLRMINDRLMAGEGDTQKNFLLAQMLQSQINGDATNAANLGKVAGGGKIGQESLQSLYDEQEKASKWLELAGMADSAIDHAGNTGFLENNLAKVAQYLPFVGGSQSDKLAGNTELDRLGQQAKALVKIKGDNMTEGDLALAMQAIPTSDKTRSQNLLANQKLKEQYGREKQIMDLAIQLARSGKVAPEMAREKATQMLGGQQVTQQVSGSAGAGQVVRGKDGKLYQLTD